MGGIRDFEEPPADYFLVGIRYWDNSTSGMSTENNETALCDI